MKILKYGRIVKGHSEKYTCRLCDSKLLVNDSDTTLVLDNSGKHYQYKCPVCFTLNRVSSKQETRIKLKRGK